MKSDKNNPVEKLNEIVTTTQSSNEQIQNTISTIEKTDQQIVDGLSNPTASTGTPMTDLNGGAKFMAQLSNIGGGSVAVGGGGIKAGFETIATNINAKSSISSQK